MTDESIHFDRAEANGIRGFANQKPGGIPLSPGLGDG